MVQNGYAILFMLVLGAGLVSLVRSFRESWTRIADVLAPEHAGTTDAVYSTTRMPAAEVPWVAQRLVLRELEEPLPEPRAFPAWTVRPVTFAEPAAG